MRAVVIHPGSLGDVILSLPALYAIKQAYPAIHLEVIGRPSILELLKGRFYAEGVISIDRADVTDCLMGVSESHQPLTRTLKACDFVINWLDTPQGEIASSLWRLGIQKMISSRPISKKAGYVHRTQIFLEYIDSLGISYPLTTPKLFPSEEDRKVGREVLVKQGIRFSGRYEGPQRPVLAIHPGSGGTHKCWDLVRFVEVFYLAQRELGFQPLFILGPAEQKVLSLNEFELSEDIPVLDTLPLPVLAGALTWCSAYIGNDSGVTHMATALGIPTIALFGPTDPALWGPLGERVMILSRRTEAGHTGDGICQGCDCLNRITVEDVITALSKL